MSKGLATNWQKRWMDQGHFWDKLHRLGDSIISWIWTKILKLIYNFRNHREKKIISHFKVKFPSKNKYVHINLGGKILKMFVQNLWHVYLQEWGMKIINQKQPYVYLLIFILEKEWKYVGPALILDWKMRLTLPHTSRLALTIMIVYVNYDFVLNYTNTFVNKSKM